MRNPARAGDIAPSAVTARARERPGELRDPLEPDRLIPVIKVGGLVKKDAEERYAMVDDQPIVAVLSADLSRQLTAPVLFYADRNVAEFAITADPGRRLL